MNATDLCYTPATELGRLIHGKQLSPVELADAVLARIERLNPKLHAYLRLGGAKHLFVVPSPPPGSPACPSPAATRV
jgi:Asp-tRNA(Asn)/Glu-tRNA(Gln) amidotransferase A subunit family amidase